MIATVSDSTIAARIAEAFPFSVDKLPLAGPEGLRTPHYGLFRGDNAECIGVACKRGYEPHTVDDVAALAEAAADAFPGETNVHCLFRDGHYVTVQPSREHRAAIFGERDNIWPRLVVRAGYDGRAFRATLGYYRDACRNLAMIRAAGNSVDANIRHTHHLREKLAELQHVFRRLAAGWDGVVETARTLDSREVDMAEFLRQVYPIPEDASRRTRGSHDRRVEKIIRRIVRERLTTGRPDLRTHGRTYLVSAWEAFNGVQGYAQHDMPRHGRPSEITRAIVALDDAAVARALDIALAV